MSVEFQPWPKIPRLNRGILITEKIDGTNAAVVILPIEGTEDAVQASETAGTDEPNAVAVVGNFAVFAQSRKRFVTVESDNYGFAAYVAENAEALVATLGSGRHFGEWYGAGIQRRYGLSEKRFALFNVDRWKDVDLSQVPRLETVPVLYRGVFDGVAVDDTVAVLRSYGSAAVPGFARPEGIVVWHYASRSSWKVTCEDDAAPKGPDGHALDEEAPA